VPDILSETGIVLFVCVCLRKTRKNCTVRYS